ncbi:hypothetical protein [Roseomonas alba]|nr:hypothetical protein [Neoroseomonas alba]
MIRWPTWSVSSAPSAPLDGALTATLSAPALQKLRNDASATPGGMPAPEICHFIRAELDRDKRLLAGTNISLN